MFTKRLYRSFQFNFKLFKSITDWTVLLYLVVPSVIISFFLYRDIAGNFQVMEIQPISLLLLFFGISFFLVKPSLRLFIYDADLLFYKQQGKKFFILNYGVIVIHFYIITLYLSFCLCLLRLLSYFHFGKSFSL